MAVDLIVRNSDGDILLGLRKNSPARNFWFVPGGRVFKNESADRAIRRISMEELGFELQTHDMKFKGVYDHIYMDNVFEDPSFNTHYIVLASEVVVPQRTLVFPEGQHSSYRFVAVANLLRDTDVHPFTKSYFSEMPTNRWHFRYE